MSEGQSCTQRSDPGKIHQDRGKPQKDPGSSRLFGDHCKLAGGGAVSPCCTPVGTSSSGFGLLLRPRAYVSPTCGFRLFLWVSCVACFGSCLFYPVCLVGQLEAFENKDDGCVSVRFLNNGPNGTNMVICIPIPPTPSRRPLHPLFLLQLFSLQPSLKPSGIVVRTIHSHLSGISVAMPSQSGEWDARYPRNI